MFTNTVVQNNYIADGVTDTFAIPFAMLASNPDWIRVFQADNDTFVETDFTRGVHYTLSPNDANPVNVVFDPGSIPVAADGRVFISREIPITQSASFTNTGAFQKENYEKAIDKFMMTVAQLQEQISRCVPFAMNQLISDAKILGVPVAGFGLKWADTLGNIGTSEFDLDTLGAATTASAAAAAASASAAAASATAASGSATAAAASETAAAASAAAAAASAATVAATPFVFTNNMSATAVTGETGDSAVLIARSYEIICVRGLLVATYRLAVIWNGTSWSLITLGFDGDDCGLTFTLTGTTTYTLNLATTNATNGGTIYAFKKDANV